MWPYAPAQGDSVTLRNATLWLSPHNEIVACACAGPYPGDNICGCHRMTVESQALKRAAHITVKLFVDIQKRNR